MRPKAAFLCLLPRIQSPSHTAGPAPGLAGVTAPGRFASTKAYAVAMVAMKAMANAHASYDAAMIAGDVNAAASAARTAAEQAAAYKVIESSVSTANAVIVRGSGMARAQVVAIYRALPGGIAAGIKSAMGAVQSAMKDLRFAIEHPMAIAHARAKLEAELTSADLAKGLASKNSEIRAAAENAKATILGQLATLPDAAGRDGTRTANAWINAFAGTLKASISSKGAVAGALDHMYSVFAAHSPPKAGPFRNIDKDGQRIGQLFAKSLGMGLGDISNAFSVAMPNLGMPGLGSLGSGTVHHDGTVRLELSATTLEAMRQAGYSGREVGQAARAASGVDGLLRNLDRVGNLPLEPSF